MAEIGVRELKARASEIVRAVRDEGARYVVTYRGRPVGMLMPIGEAEGQPKSPLVRPDDAWAELVALGEEVGRGWELDTSALDLLSGMRR
jgi:prevent-host-death family protein